jgi:hypothetical protein
MPALFSACPSIAPAANFFAATVYLYEAQTQKRLLNIPFHGHKSNVPGQTSRGNFLKTLSKLTLILL